MGVIASAGKIRNRFACLARVMDRAWWGVDVTSRDIAPIALNDEFLTAQNAAGTGTVNLMKANASDQVELGAVAAAKGDTVVHAKFLTVTLTQLKAGQVVVAAVAGRTLKVVGFRLKFTGTFTTSTTIRLSDTNSSPVDIATVAIANATDANILTEAGGTGLTIGTFGAALTADKGIQLRDVTAGQSAGGTSIDVLVLYTIA